MAKKSYDFRQELINLIYINLAILVILLSIFNLQTKKKDQITVLGANDDLTYWEELVKKHPTYRDGWVELGRIDIVKQIDPNFQLP